MEFSGDEKRIKALFCERQLADQNHAPHFAKLWRRAEVKTLAPRPLVWRSAAVVLTVVVVGMSLVAARSWSNSLQVADLPSQIIPATSGPRIQQIQFVTAKDVRAVQPRRVVRPRQTGHTAIRGAEALANWQSPTNILLNSPTASFLSSLPQLNQSARDLEQFLPKNNEVMKESKQ